MDHVIGLKCVLCGAEYAPDEVLYVCPKHGDEGILDVVYDYDLIRRRLTRESLTASGDRSIWRYKPLLPVHPESPVPPLTVGWTPLHPAQRLREHLGLTDLWLKDDTHNPSASFKDRASAVGIVKAQELGRVLIVAASTGNAAASLACLSASVGVRNVIFVPESAPQAKIAQLLVFGATVIAVQGSYDQAFDLCAEFCRRSGAYSRNTATNPMLSEGKKTLALEIWEQLGFRAPEFVVVPVGDGCIIGGLWKGFHDLLQLGFIDHMPRLVGVQAEGCQPIKRAFETGQAVQTVQPQTMADSIAVGQPRDALKALRALRDSDGFMVAVSDQQILDAMGLLARKTGVFGEPAGVTGFAGLLKALSQNRLDPGERVVVVVTGNGLKDVDSALRASIEPTEIEPSLEAVDRELRSRT